MKRIELPGKSRNKKILLLILIVLSIAVLFKVRMENKQVKIKEEKVKEEQKLEDERIRSEQEEINKKLEEENIAYEKVREQFFNGDYKESIKGADILIGKFPQSYKGYNIRGIAKAYDGSFQEGMEDIDKALEIKPDYGYARFNKALNYELYNKFSESLQWYDKALEVEEYMWSYYGKASIYGRKGDVDNTVVNLKKALEVASKEGKADEMKEEAKIEHDFDPVRNSEKFKEILY